MTAKADSLVPQKDGQIKLTIDGKRYMLRRPTIGEQWTFDEGYAGVIQREKDDIDWAKEQLNAAGQDFDDSAMSLGALLGLIRQVDPYEAAKRKQDRQRVLLEWWLTVFAKLGASLPDWEVESLPGFLADYATVGLAQEAWARNPQDPGDE